LTAVNLFQRWWTWFI